MPKWKIAIFIFIFVISDVLVLRYQFRYQVNKEIAKLNLDVLKLENQNVALKNLIKIQNKELSRCGFLRSVKYEYK